MPQTKREIRRGRTGKENDAARGDGSVVLENICFFFHVLYDRYVDVLKSHLRKHAIDDTLRSGYGFVLFSLFEEDELRPSEISSRTGLKASTLTAILDQMEKRRLVARSPDDRDRRAILVRLLPAGEKLRSSCYRILEEMSDMIVDGIRPRDLEIAKRAMQRMAANMMT